MTTKIYDYTLKNEDDINQAVHGLNIFMKNYCMDCKHTERMNEPIFRCDDCLFGVEDSKICLIKKFVSENKHLKDFNYPLNEFGAITPGR